MRKKKALLNITFSMVLEVVTVISGFVLPKLIIETYGSETNGLLNSISSFIGYIVLLQSGVGSVIKASMYRPLAEKNKEQLMVIIKTVEDFFKKIAYASVVYILLLAILFPALIAPQYEFWFSASLVVIVGISTAAQYFFGITYQMLLEADQRSYVYSIVQLLTVIVNTILCVVLIKSGQSINVVKLGSAVIFVLRPISLNIYAKRFYKINKKVKADKNVLKQRWDGLAQAIAYFVHSKADIFVLTIFSTLSNVSIYGIYHMVTLGITSVVKSVDKAVSAAFGNVIAKGEKAVLDRSFKTYNTLIHLLVTTIFATAAVSVSRFVEVYVKGVSDAEYIQPLFAWIIISAEMIYCLRLPYNNIIYAAGKFKETKSSAYVEAVMNIAISILLVKPFGLVGVAIATLVAMIYRTLSFIVFLRKEVLYLSYIEQMKRYAITAVAYTAVGVFLKYISMSVYNYISWGIYAVIVFVLAGLIVLAVNMVLDKKNSVEAIKLLLKK